jgi:hypothetical protein
MPENLLVIHHEGETKAFPLEDHQAKRLLACAEASKLAPPWKPLPEIQVNARRAAREKIAADFGAQIQRFANLNQGEMGLVLALVELIEFGDQRLCGVNWIFNHVETLLETVIRDGPAKANCLNPMDALAALGAVIDEHWRWIDDGSELHKGYPDLFPAPSPTPTVPKQTPKRSRPRSKKAA